MKSQITLVLAFLLLMLISILSMNVPAGIRPERLIKPVSPFDELVGTKPPYSPLYINVNNLG
jgi:hypothetical protein